MTRTHTAPSASTFHDLDEPHATHSPEHEFEQHHEGPVATTIERQTARLPSDTFLWAAGASIAGSLALQIMNRKEDANFVGQWAPVFLCLGIYNKMVKLLGHDYAH